MDYLTAAPYDDSSTTIRLFDDPTNRPYTTIQLFDDMCHHSTIRAYHHSTTRLFDDSTIAPFHYTTFILSDSLALVSVITSSLAGIGWRLLPGTAPCSAGDIPLIPPVNSSTAGVQLGFCPPPMSNCFATFQFL